MMVPSATNRLDTALRVCKAPRLKLDTVPRWAVAAIAFANELARTGLGHDG